MKHVNLKEKTIYKDLGLFSIEEEKQLIKDYFDGCEEDMEGLTEDQIRDRINDWNISCYEDDFGPEGNWYYSDLKNTPVVITGTLGLWNGRHKIDNVKCDNLEIALGKILNNDIDYVIDACDSISTKKSIILECLKRKIKFVSSMGTANKLDPSKLSITDIRKTKSDPIAKILRKWVKDMKINGKITVVSTEEVPIKKGKVLSTMSFVPNTAGILAANYIIKDIIKI